MRKSAGSFVLISLVAALAAQDKPDFSGRWVLEDPLEAAPDVPRALTIRQSLVTTTALGSPMEPFFKDLTIEREFEQGKVSDSYWIGIVGGVIGGLDKNGRGYGPGGESPLKRFSVVWDGNRLVIETGRYSGRTLESGPYSEHKEVWWLDETSKLVMTVTHRTSEAEPVTRTLTYGRR